MLKFVRKLLTSVAPVVALATSLTSVSTTAAKAQDFYLGQIIMGGWTFCPRGTMEASGALLPIAQYSALFSLYGTIYGGDGRTTFGLPDLRGRSAINYGQGAGLPYFQLGQRGGAETHVLTTNQMPSHNHMVNANNGQVNFADRLGPGNDFLGSPDVNEPGNPAQDIRIYSDQTPNVQMDPRMIEHTGGNQAFNIRDPFLALRYCIVSQGTFPSRN